MAASQKESAPAADPRIYILDGFAIETYASISDVPYASVSEQRGKALKTSEHERFDELYGRCRTCVGQKFGEQLILCDDCDRGFHMTCLVPILRDIPKGEWHCPKCTRERLHNAHVRATSVSNLGKVMSDIATRASLPPKLQLKLLDIAGPVVEFRHVEREQNRKPHPNAEKPPKSRLRRHSSDVPPKIRMKRPRPPQQPLAISEQPEMPVAFSTISGQNFQKRMRSISQVANDLAPVALKLGEKNLSVAMKDVEKQLWANSRTQNGMVQTKPPNGLPGTNQHKSTTGRLKTCGKIGQCYSRAENLCPSAKKGAHDPTNDDACHKSSCTEEH